MSEERELEDLRSALREMTILYVEDEEEVQSALTPIIERRSKRVVTACNGEEGLKAFQEVQPDIVITDINMPIMDGLEMSRNIKELSHTTPIIITTAYNDTEFLLKAIDVGINQFVLKPMDSRKLFNALLHCAKELTYEARLEKSNDDLLMQMQMLKEYKKAVDLGSIVSITDPEGIITTVNDAFCDITGYERNELIGQTHALIKVEEQNLINLEAIDQAKHDKEVFRGVLRNRHKNGSIFYVDLVIVPILDEAGRVIEYIELRNDVTKLIEQIYTDPLTGYPNRAALSKRIEACEKAPLLLLINLDAFKDINDFYGNHVGDFILREMTVGLDVFIKDHIPHATLYKLSGDEFAILIESSIDNKLTLVEELEEFIENKVFFVDENEISLAASIGSSSSERNLLTNADMALKYAKSHHQEYADFEDVAFVEKEHEQNIIWTKKLKTAIQNDCIVPYFQPIIDNRSKRIVKFECLMRLIDEDNHVVTPYYFLEIAQSSRLYHKLTRIMIEKSFQIFENEQYDFSLNLSATDILNHKVMEFLADRIKHYKIADRLILEVTETEDFEQYDQIKEALELFKGLGCRIAIDDFGSGYSNFQHLINLNVDFIKIDGSLIKNITDDTNSQIVTQTIAIFADKLGAKTIAEFVHNASVQDEIERLGINYSQGYYFGEPKPTLLRD